MFVDPCLTLILNREVFTEINNGLRILNLMSNWKCAWNRAEVAPSVKTKLHKTYVIFGV